MARLVQEFVTLCRLPVQGRVIQLFHAAPALLVQCGSLHVPGPLAVTHRVYAKAMAAHEVAAAEMNWSMPCGKPVSKYGWNPKARERTNHVPSSSCVRRR